MRDVAQLAQVYPAIEISLMQGVDFAFETEAEMPRSGGVENFYPSWEGFGEILDMLQGISSVKFVGLDGEHCMYNWDGINANWANSTWNQALRDGVITEADAILFFDRAKQMVEARGFTFICYYISIGSQTFKDRYLQYGHTNYPCNNLTGGDPEYTLDWFTAPNFKGISCGLSEQHTFPDENHWSSINVGTVLAHGVEKPDAIRSCINFATGQTPNALPAWTGVSGVQTRQLHDHPTWRQRVWEQLQTYPQGTFILAIDQIPTYPLTINTTEQTPTGEQPLAGIIVDVD
jgi:hypothetical protein